MNTLRLTTGAVVGTAIAFLINSPELAPAFGIGFALFFRFFETGL